MISVVVAWLYIVISFYAPANHPGMVRCAYLAARSCDILAIEYMCMSNYVTCTIMSQCSHVCSKATSRTTVRNVVSVSLLKRNSVSLRMQCNMSKRVRTLDINARLTRHIPTAMTSTWCGLEHIWNHTFYAVFRNSRKSIISHGELVCVCVWRHEVSCTTGMRLLIYKRACCP